jgi:SNF2 family DNA or RNA helicase
MINDVNNEYIPSSQEIFYAVFGGVKPKGYRIPEKISSLKESFPNLKFSKIGSKLTVGLCISEHKITGDVYFVRHGQNYLVRSPYIGGADHIIINGQWIYLSENYTQVATLLQESGITNIAEISFSSYIKLLSLLSSYPTVIVEDKVRGNLDSITECITADLPQGLKATLYPYQTTGYKWIKFITDENCGCVLGDEMGLGKTLQVITLLLQRKSLNSGSSLVIAPVSLLENWRREILRFAPVLSVLVNHGANRSGRYTDLQEHDVVVISYNSAISDLSMLKMIKWDLLIIDEAQNIKNPNATRSKAVKEIPRRASIAVTGTPFENHIVDIWSIVDFSMPGFLGTLGAFQSDFSDDIEGARKIEPILSSLMLRRRVADVAKDLPDKVIISQPLVMDNIEANSYEEVRQQIMSEYSNKAVTLAALIKLRMFCTHPFIVRKGNKHGDPTRVSIKYTRLCEILEEIVASNEKIILFTSYSDMFALFEEDIPTRFNIPVLSINGSTPVPDRQPIVDSFSNTKGSALLVLNPRAAGTGLNITAANHVIHFNLEWNPALEDQSTARAFRRGQEKTVFVYRFYYINTVEQFVNEKIETKRDMSDLAVVGTTGELDNRSDILAALMKSPVLKEE